MFYTFSCNDDSDVTNAVNLGGKPDPDFKMLKIADRTFDAMQSAIARQQLAAYPPDIELIIPNNVCGTLEFNRADEMIQLGYELAARKLSSLSTR